MTGWRKARGSLRTASARSGVRVTAATVVLSLLLAIAAVTVPSSASAKDDYPTFADVQAAKASVSKKKALIARIEDGIARLENKVKSTQALATKAGDAAQAADQAFQEQNLKVETLQAQADAAKADAASARQRAGELLVEQYRSSGNNNITIDLLLNASKSKDILYSLGMSKTLVAQSQGIFDAAKQAENTAQSLTDQANVAKDELGVLKKDSDDKLAVAAAAADTAAAALQEQQDNIAAQQELLAAAKSKVETTQADYNKGVQVRAAAEAKRLAQQQGVVSGVYNSAPPFVNGAWAQPETGPITSGFGYRLIPYRSFHLGTDIGAPCGSYIYAAHGGTVSYSGWNGIYGNFLRIDIGDGVQNEYGHILNGGLLVRVGQTVTVGQHIANVGRTGGATGCHLHFGVRVNGLVTDPVPFMRTYGIQLGG